MGTVDLDANDEEEDDDMIDDTMITEKSKKKKKKKDEEEEDISDLDAVITPESRRIENVIVNLQAAIK